MSAPNGFQAPRVLIVRNAERSGPGRLLPWLRDEGLAAVELAGPEAPADPAGYDGVVLLGGGFLPDDDAYAPWLPAQRDLTRRAVAEGVPLLGICLGAQVLAVAEGGRVEGSYGVPERGSCAVELREEAGADRLLAGLPRRFRAIQNHRDQITRLPSGSTHLARSDACEVQAFRVGECAWGVQFHPEAGADRLDGWDEAALAEKGLGLAALRTEAQAAEPASTDSARRLAANFAAVVRAHA
ncbi:GMP synthase - Glutamine amidotransferase domain- like protein [Streptomyces bingchenggensis BCW-1]|uniref:GMP synthase-Glutamine amidotransferase domain-like protein n=1 Tax=Streptomyces bingchenggensis (strain BCW-1) TaxID=749414 RepID=D7BSD6_STRBB|nr:MULTISPECIES: type 1 glutamine amidotransferase [Streptomyces]ADI09454.1 GMP synthase - Glutamine amidotransferase domain- like protein [Streptomyces bingchenggensis BCW-1]